MTEQESRDDEGQAPREGERRVSFVQRLERHFGDDVDPAITLQDVSEEDADDGVPDSGTSLGLVKKLSGHVNVGARYQIVREIARGGMGAILRVWDDDLRRNLAMKVMHSARRFDDESSTGGYDQEKLGRFLEEAQITGQLDHPGIVPVHELGIDDDGRLFFTMRLVKGKELREVLDLAREGKERWTTTKAIGLILKVCESMAFAHSKGVVHRDLKPSNVMVGRYGEVYVMDWGLARLVDPERVARAVATGVETPPPRRKPRVDESSLSLVRSVRKDESEANPDSPLVTMDGDVVGTPSYMALEQAQGKLDLVGPRSDVFALGAILYYMLSGRSPYVEPGERVSPHTVLNRVLSGPPTPISKLATDQPAELIAICEKAMSRDLVERYASMEEVAEDLQAYLENRVVSAYEGGAFAEFRKWVVRNRGMAAAVVGMVLLSIVSALGFGIQKDKRAAALAEVNADLEAEREKAELALEEADKSAREARQNLRLAEQRERDAADNEQLALDKEAEARRSSYMANVLAASYSLKLNDVEEMRDRLQDTDPRQREWEWKHLSTRAYPALRTFLQPDGRTVDQVAWSRTGSSLATLGRDGALRFLDAESGVPASRELIDYPVIAGIGSMAPLRMDLTADGSRVAIVGGDRSIRVFDAWEAESLFTLPEPEVVGHASRVGAVAFSRDGLLLVSGADNGSVMLWDAEGGLERRFPRHTGAVTDLAWSPDSSVFASASADGTVRVWDVALGQPLHRLQGHQGGVRSVVWDADGNHLFSGGDDGMVNQWSGRRGALVASFSGHRGPIRAMAFEPESRRLVTASEDRTLRVWDVRDGSQTVFLGHVAAVVDVDFSPDGSQVISCAENGEIKVWDVRGDLSVTALDFHERRIEAVAFSPDSEYALTGDEKGELVLWDSYSGEPLRRFRDHSKAITEVVFDEETDSFFTSSVDGLVHQYTRETALRVASFGHDSSVASMLVLPGGRLLTSCADERVRIYDIETQLLVHEYVVGTRQVGNLALHPDGELFAGTSGSNLVVRDIRGESVELNFHRQDFVYDCAFSPSGDDLVSGTRGEVCIWDVEGRNARVVMSDHDRSIRAVAFHPSGERFASGAADETIRIRDAETGETALVLDWPGAHVTALTFSPDGARLLAGASDGRVRIWETGDRGERRRRWLALRGIRDQVSPLVEGLFDGYFFLRDVLTELQTDSSLDQAQRQAAILLANLRGDDPESLYEESLREALAAGASEDVYERALRRIQAADQMEGAGEIPAVHLARGVAQLRTGSVRGALDSLELARERSEHPSEPSIQPLTAEEETIRLLFLAMGRQAEGHHALARSTLDTARAHLDDHPDLAAEPRLMEVLTEAEDVIEGAG